MAHLVFMALRSEQHIDMGGSCGHTSPDGFFDDCLCRDGWYIPAGIEDGYTAGYCDRNHTYDNAPF